MAATQRTKLAVVSSAVVLLLGGLVTLSVTFSYDARPARSVTATHLHQAIVTATQLAPTNPNASEAPQLDGGILAGLLLLAASFAAVGRGRLAARNPGFSVVEVSPSRGPPATR